TPAQSNTKSFLHAHPRRAPCPAAPFRGIIAALDHLPAERPTMRISPHLLGTLAIGLVIVTGARAEGCPFCNAGRATLTQEATQATLILYGTPTNPQFNPNAAYQGTTDLQIETVIKSHPFIKDKKTVTIDRYLAIDKANPKKYLVFCDVFKD